jgi:hypothetical protein
MVTASKVAKSIGNIMIDVNSGTMGVVVGVEDVLEGVEPDGVDALEPEGEGDG